MRKFRFLFPAFILLFSFNSFTQDGLFMPLNIQRAYENGTRSLDGRPGENYWINSADYRIDASITPHKHYLNGTATVQYHNNSSDTLDYVLFKMTQNIYQKGAPRDFGITAGDIHDGMTVSRLVVNGEELRMDDEGSGVEESFTVMKVPVRGGIVPGGKAAFEIHWSFTLPSERRIRMGAYSDSLLYFAYWYPQIAVYDDINGWDNVPHTGYAEFYNDHNSYDVTLTAPHGFFIWATGLLQNRDEIFTAPVLERIAKAEASSEVVNIITADDYESGGLQRDAEVLSWRYTASSAPDFAFGVSNYYLWDAVTVELDNGASVFVDAAYDPDSDDFYEVAQISAESIRFFSEDLPGYPYPYPALTVFNGSGGMEFPMIINDGSYQRKSATVHVTSHEILHQYYPFYTGMSEKRFSFLDEGLAVMLPRRYQEQFTGPGAVATANSRGYARIGGTGDEIVPFTASYQMSGSPYRLASYTRPALAYMYLEDALGVELFAEAMYEFTERWALKHASPYDMFYTFNDVTGQDLSWYFGPWFFEHAYADLAIEEVKASDSGLSVVVANKGGLPLPVQVKVMGVDGKEKTVTQSAEVWSGDDNRAVLSVELDFVPQKVILGSDQVPDLQPSNNTFEL